MGLHIKTIRMRKSHLTVCKKLINGLTTSTRLDRNPRMPTGGTHLFSVSPLSSPTTSHVTSLSVSSAVSVKSSFSAFVSDCFTSPYPLGPRSPIFPPNKSVLPCSPTLLPHKPPLSVPCPILTQCCIPPSSLSLRSSMLQLLLRFHMVSGKVVI